MDRKHFLFVCVATFVFRLTHSELDLKPVKGTAEKSLDITKYGAEQSQSVLGKDHTSFDKRLQSMSARNSEKYSSKNVDYGYEDDDKFYNTDFTSSNGHGGSSYKDDYDGDNRHEDREKTNHKDDGGMGYSNDPFKKNSYNSVAGRSPDVTCSYGVKFIAHPYECTKFYQCAHSKPFLFTCPSGLYFNTDLDVCDWPSNVECSNDNSYEPAYQTSKETSYKSSYEPSYKTKNEPNDKANYDYSNTDKYEPSPRNDHQYKYKSKSTFISKPRMESPPQPPPLQSPSIYEYPDSYHERGYEEPKYYTGKKHGAPSFKDSSKHYDKEHSVMSAKYPVMSSYQPIMPSQFLPVSAIHFPLIPVLHSPMYHPFIPYQPDKGEGSTHQSEQKDYKLSQSLGPASKEHKDTASKQKEDSKYQDESTSKEPRSQVIHASTAKPVPADDNKQSNVQNVKKVIITKNRAVEKQDDSGQSKPDDASSKRFYYYYYEDDSKDNNNNNQKQNTRKIENKDPYYYYYYDSSIGKYKELKQNELDNYDNKYYYDYNNDYYYGNDYGSSHGQVQHLVSADKNYNRKRRGFKPAAKYQKVEKITDEDLGFIHFDHTPHGSKNKRKGQGENELTSLLPLLLLGGANGGQQLLITSLLLSKLKSSGGNGEFLGNKRESGGEKDDLIKKFILMYLLTGNNARTTPTVNVPNVQIMNGQFVNIATGQPAILIDPLTGQQVTPAQTSINPATGQLVVTATGNPVFLQDPVSGNLQVAILGNSLTVQGNPLLPVTGRRQLLRRFTPANSVNNRLIPLAPTLSNQNAASASGRDAVNLIFLSPLTPSSLPPPIINGDGRATLIRGSLRDILGPNLANFMSNVPLVSGQGSPNSVASNKQSCNVVRSGETVPFRLTPRGGRRLSVSECDAIGKLLDKFVPTFLQNFVPSDAAFAGFGSNTNNGLQPPPAGQSKIVGVSRNSSTTKNNNLSINDFINVKNDNNGCTIAVPNIIPQC